MNPLPKFSNIWVQPKRTQMTVIEVSALVSGLPLDDRQHGHMCIMLMLVAGIPVMEIASWLGMNAFKMARQTDIAVDLWRGDTTFRICYDSGVESIKNFPKRNEQNWVQAEEESPQAQLPVLPRARAGRGTVEGKKRTLAKRNSKAMGKP